MTTAISKNIRLGFFVLLGTGFLVFALYLIGVKKNLFGSTFHLRAQFHNVNGLMSGNNVRFTGINVGTVERVEIIDDSTVNVVMVIEKKVRLFIKKNSLAMVGTDGLMGNKLININSISDNYPAVEDGDLLKTRSPVGTDEMMRTLSVTNQNVREISDYVKKIVQKLNSPNTLWNILMDTVIAENVKQAIVNIKITGERTAAITEDISKMINNVKSGKGIAGALLTDTTFSNKLHQSVTNVKQITDSLALVTGDLHRITSIIKNGKGAAGTILMDTTFATNLNKSLENIKNGSKGFDENMEALKHTTLLRHYFKKQNKIEPIPKNK